MEELKAFRSELFEEARKNAIFSRKIIQWTCFVIFLVIATIGAATVYPEIMINGSWIIAILALLTVLSCFIFPIGKPGNASIQKEIKKLVSYKCEWNPIAIGCAQKEIEKQRARLDEAKKELRLLSLLNEPGSSPNA